jgi:hypothetical protein
MSLYDKASLVQIPSGTKDGTLYSVLPANGDGDFTHVRATSATRVNKDGLIESVASGVPRLNYPLIDGVVQSCPALLLEPSRTNYLRYSEDLSQSNWSKQQSGTGVAPTVTANYAISPDGSQNASRVQFDLNGGTTISDRSRLSQDAGTGTSGSQAYSVYVKSNDSSSHAIVFRALGGAFNIKTVTTEWQRIDMIATDNSFYFELGLYGDSATADTADILIWGAQMEEGSYPTSYIPTTSAAVTRNADFCNDAGTSAEFNDSEGVLFVEFQGLTSTDADNGYVSISDGTATNSVLINTRTSGSVRLYNGGVGSTNLIYIETVDYLNTLKIALKYGTTTGSYKVYINGISKTISGTFSATSMSGLDELKFQYAVGGNNFYGKVKQLMVFNEALTDSELEQVTSWTSFGEMAKGQLYTIE